MCLQVGRIDHHRLCLAVLGCQASHHLSKDALVAPPLPAVVERFRGLRGPTGATVPFNCADHTLSAHPASVSHCG